MEAIEMKKSWWIISAVLLFVAIAAPAAHADLVDGTIDFTVDPDVDGPAPTGSFVYDSTTGDLVSLSLVWDGEDYSADFLEIFAGEFVSDIGTSGGWCANADDTPSIFVCGYSEVNMFSLLGPTEMLVSDSANHFTDDEAYAYGGYTVTTVDEGGSGGGGSVPAPEPSSLALMLAGIAVVTAGCKHLTRRAARPLHRPAH
jgi:hypothetical protein